VSAIHSELITTALAPDFYRLFPERFNNKTNGITQRRWLLNANPGLASLITRVTGDSWTTDLCQLRNLEKHAGDAGFQTEFRKVKRANKVRRAGIVKELLRLSVDPDSL